MLIIIYPPERFSRVVSLSDFKWKSASHLDSHGVLCETQKFSREPTASFCNLTRNSKNGALFGDYKFSNKSFTPTVSTTSTSIASSTTKSSIFGFPAGNIFETSSRQSVDEMKKCFQAIDCGKQHPIMFIVIKSFDLSLVSAAQIIIFQYNNNARLFKDELSLETKSKGLHLVPYNLHQLVEAANQVTLRHVSKFNFSLLSHRFKKSSHKIS